MQKTSPPPGFDPRTVQLVAIRYTGYVIPVHRLVSVQITYWFLSGPVFEAIQPPSYVLVLSIPNLSCKQLKLGNISRIIFGLYGHNVFISSVSQLHISFISHFPVWLFKCWITNLVIHLHDYLTPKTTNSTIHTTSFNIDKIRFPSLPPFESHNKQQIFSNTSCTDWSL